MIFKTYNILDFKKNKRKSFLNEDILLKLEPEDIKECLQNIEMYKTILWFFDIQLFKNTKKFNIFFLKWKILKNLTIKYKF